MVYVMGRRLKPYEMTDKSYEDLTEEEINEIRDKIKDSMQEDLDEAVKEHGQKPYQWREFWKASWANRQYFPYYYPFMWPFLFTEFERQWIKHSERGAEGNIQLETKWYSWMLWLVKNPITLFYYLPIIGWIPLAIKGYWKSKLRG
jgi:hypothetical protein